MARRVWIGGPCKLRWHGMFLCHQLSEDCRFCTQNVPAVMVIYCRKRWKCEDYYARSTGSAWEGNACFILCRNISVYLSQYLTNLMHKICFTISFISCLYMFRAHVLIIRRSILHYTASGMILFHASTCFEHMCSSSGGQNYNTQPLAWFYFMPLHVSSTCAHHQEVKITIHSLWYDFISCLYMFRAHVLIIRRSKLYYTASNTRGCNAILTSWWWTHVLETCRGMK